MAFLHLNFDNFEFRDLGHSDFLSFKVLVPTQINNLTKHSFGDIFLYIWCSKKNLCDTQQCIISRVIGNLVERPTVELPHLRAR